MTLSQEDGQLYYSLWLPLLDYVNGKYQVSSQLKNIAAAQVLDPEEVKKVANMLWSDETIIDEYLKENDDLPEEHKEIIQSWKRRIQGKFMMERHLKKGSIFISLEKWHHIELGGNVLWSANATHSRSNLHAIQGRDHISWIGNAIFRNCRWRNETDV